MDTSSQTWMFPCKGWWEVASNWHKSRPKLCHIETYTSIKCYWNHTKYIKIPSANPANHLRVVVPPMYRTLGFMFWVQVVHNFGLPSTPIISVFFGFRTPLCSVSFGSTSAVFSEHPLPLWSSSAVESPPAETKSHCRFAVGMGSPSGSWRDTHKKERFTGSYRFFPWFLSMLIPSLNHGDMHPNSLIHWMISFINILVNLHSNIIWPHIFHDLFYPSPLNILTCHSLGCSFNPLGARISRAKTFSFAAMDANPKATALDIYFISHNVS